MKTFEQCCDEVAKRHFGKGTLVAGHLPKYFKEAAELHAREKVKEAVELCKKGNEDFECNLGRGCSYPDCSCKEFTQKEILEKLGL